jgi:small subunit ribosomal protein S20
MNLATHKSAEKRARQTKRRTTRNVSVKSALKTLEKRVRTAVANKDGKAAVDALKLFVASFDKAASKGVIHEKKASRKTGRLSALVQGLTK